MFQVKSSALLGRAADGEPKRTERRATLSMGSNRIFRVRSGGQTGFEHKNESKNFWAGLVTAVAAQAQATDALSCSLVRKMSSTGVLIPVFAALVTGISADPKIDSYDQNRAEQLDQSAGSINGRCRVARS
jgi:hypothetical protein